MLRAILFSTIFSLLPCVAVQAASDIGVQLSDAILKRYQPTIDVMTHHGWDHSNSVILHGIEKIYATHPDPKYLAYIKAYVDDFVAADGSIKGLELTLDGMHPGVLCLFLYQKTGEDKYRIAAKNMRDHLLGTESSPTQFGKTPEGGYWHKTDEKYRNVMSVDGLYMAYPFLVHYGQLFGDQSAIDVAVQQIQIASSHSFNIKSNLPYHAWSFDGQKPWANPITGTASQFWSRSVGWYAMALVDVLEFLPKENPAYTRVLLSLQSLAQGIKATQNPADGLWCQVVDACGKSQNYSEVSGSGMIVYALKKAVNLQLLDSGFNKVSEKAWRGIKQHIKTFDDGGPQINSVAPPMSSQVDYSAYVAIRPITVPTRDGPHHAHAYIGVLMAASVMETSVR